MAIPNQPQFERMLAGLALNKPTAESDYESIIAVEPVMGRDGQARVAYPGITLWHPPKTNGFAIDSLIKRLQSELASLGHVGDKRIAMAILCAYVLLRRPSSNPVEVLNNLLEMIVSGDLTQIYVSALRPPQGYGFKFGSFMVGPLNYERLSYRSKRALSDFHMRYAEELKGKLAIEREIIKIKAIDWKLLLKQLRKDQGDENAERAIQLIVDGYFEYVAAAYFERFWDQLRRQQELTVAVGAGHFDDVPLRMLAKGMSVSVFLEIGKSRSGYVSPNSTITTIDLASTDRTIPKAVELLEAHGVSDADSGEFYNTFRLYCRFVSRAKLHLWSGRQDDAFLHFVIALDLLFGERDASNKAVGERVALVTHLRLGKSFDEAKKSIQDLYDKRSRYVHSGQQVTEGDVIDAISACDEVVQCLLRLYSLPTSHENDFVSRWLKQLDYLSSALKAGRIVPKAEFEANGIYSST